MNAEAGRRLRAFVMIRWPGEQQDLYPAVGFTKQSVLAWFSGRAEPSLTAITEIARVLRVERWRIVAALDGDGPE